MGFKLYEAKLKTGGKTREQLVQGSTEDVDEEIVATWRRAYDSLDGKEVLVVNVFEGSYTPFSWRKEDDDVFRDFSYLAEQDGTFGTYIGEREQFLKDWENDEYEPSGSLSFDAADVEIIKALTNS